jgi:GntR family transcriptional regulator, carbon starvation induced regulator
MGKSTAKLVDAAELGGGIDTVVTSDVARDIRRDILTARMMPGEKLRFEKLRARFSASMGTLREALVRLQAEGLVEGGVGRGFRVAPVSIEQLADIERLRIMLETDALRASIISGSEVWEAEVLAALHIVSRIEDSGDITRLDDEWEERHRAFHLKLLSACGSPWMMHFCRVLFDQSSRYRRLVTMFEPPKLRSDEHRAIVDAVLARDADKACRLLIEHIKSTRITLAANLQDGQLLEDALQHAG